MTYRIQYYTEAERAYECYKFARDFTDLATTAVRAAAKKQYELMARMAQLDAAFYARRARIMMGLSEVE